MIEKDSLSEDGFNQIKGGILNGSFEDGELESIYVKNTQVIYYLYSDEDNELIGINKPSVVP